MIGTFLLLAAARQPAWLDFNLAGYTILPSVRRSSVGVHDAAKDHYLVREYECDGGCATVLLTRDRRAVERYGYRVPGLSPNPDATKELKRENLRHLATGKGLAIGDSVAKARKVLGQPGKQRHPEGFPDCDEWVYAWQENHAEDENPTEHEATYTFKGGKLIEIKFSRSSC